MTAISLLTVEDFKHHVRVGDTLIGYSHQREIKVTAIGEFRFLYRSWQDQECVSKMVNLQANWKKVIPSEVPCTTISWPYQAPVEGTYR